MTPATAAGFCSHCGAEHDGGATTCPLTGKLLSMPGLCGTEVDRYRVERMLGGGGFGAVYQAYHTVMGRRVALKVLDASQRTNPAVLQRFFQEARAANSIGSPHIVQIYDAGWSSENLPFLAMELLNGCSLWELTQKTPVLPVGRALTIAAQVLDALGAAHAAGIIHRDVKSGNVMLVGTTPEGPEQLDFVKLVDFGISKFREQETGLTRSGMTLGTPGCAAPEQYMESHTVDHRADLYAVAVMLFQMLAGRLPFEITSYEKMVIQVATQDPPPLAHAAPHVPPHLAAVVDRGLRRDPNERWPDAASFAFALSEAFGSAIAMPDPAPTSSDHVPLELTTPTPTPIGMSGPRSPVVAPTMGATPGSMPRPKPGAAIAPTFSAEATPRAPVATPPAIEAPTTPRPAVAAPPPTKRSGLAIAILLAVVLGAGLTAGAVAWMRARPPAPPATAQPPETNEGDDDDPTVGGDAPETLDRPAVDGTEEAPDTPELATADGDESSEPDAEDETPPDPGTDDDDDRDEAQGSATAMTTRRRSPRQRPRAARETMDDPAPMQTPPPSGEVLRPGLVPYDR